jgi:hypothetical protein
VEKEIKERREMPIPADRWNNCTNILMFIIIRLSADVASSITTLQKMDQILP